MSELQQPQPEVAADWTDEPPVRDSSLREWLQADISLEYKGDRPIYPWLELGELITSLRTEGRFRRWFFMVKPPGLRVRFEGDELATLLLPHLVAWLERASAARIIHSYRFGVYEPEIFRFGGPVGMSIAHEHFDRDCWRALLYETLPAEARRSLPPLLWGLAQAGGLIGYSLADDSETWDVWMRLARLFPEELLHEPSRFPEDELLDAALVPDSLTIGRSERVQALIKTAMKDDLIIAQKLLAATTAGVLMVGIRSWLATTTLFQWNRLRLSREISGPALGVLTRRLAPPETKP